MVMKDVSARLKTLPSLKIKPRTIAAGEFKARCLQIMDEVQQTGGTVIITKRGKPVAQLTASVDADAQKPVSFFGLTKGSMTILGDIVSPLPNEWEADQD
jgi:prevent-host-death family protein